MKSFRISLAFTSSSTATHEPFCYATCQNETNQTKFIKRIGLDDILERYLNTANTRKVSPSKSIGVLLRNIILHRTPIYDLQDWASRYRPTLFGLDSEQMTSLNDDRIGRDLDMLFDVDPASILTEVVVRAIKEFKLDLSRFHNDSTTITFSGIYKEATGEVFDGNCRWCSSNPLQSM